MTAGEIVSDHGQSGYGPPMTDVRGPADLREYPTGELLAQLTAQLTRLVRAELRLAQLELRGKGARAGLGLGLGGVAGVLAVLGLGACTAAAVVALALAVPWWASALIVGAVLLAAAGLLGLVAVRQAKRATPPLPEEAVEGLSHDAQLIKEHVGHGSR